MMPSFSFIEADLDECHLLVGVLDGTLKAGCSNVIEDDSVHAIGMGVFFHVASLLTLNRQQCQVSAS